MTPKAAQRKAEALAPGRSLIVTQQEQKTMHSDGKHSYNKRCTITVFDKVGSGLSAFDGHDFASALVKVRQAMEGES